MSTSTNTWVYSLLDSRDENETKKSYILGLGMKMMM